MSVYRRAREIRFRHLGEETVVLRQSDACVVVLNEVGGRILELAEGRTRSEIVEDLATEFDVERGVLENDVVGFLQELLSSGLIEEASGEEEEVR
jgi:GeoRSP system PqqD family protein